MSNLSSVEPKRTPFVGRCTLSPEQIALRDLERKRDALMQQLRALNDEISALKMAVVVAEYVPTFGPNHVYRCLCGEKFSSALAYAGHQPDCREPRDSRKAIRKERTSKKVVGSTVMESF